VKPDPTPGELLWSLMGEQGMTQIRLAQLTRRPAQAWSEIGQGKKRVTAETAVQLESVFGVAAEEWLRLQAVVDLRRVRLGIPGWSSR
jgi:addiction module HigA family antidote